MKYKQYLKSADWQKMKNRVRGYGGKQCYFCGKKKNLHLHHKTYKRLFNENYKTDLFFLCAKHHLLVHTQCKEKGVNVWEMTSKLKKDFLKKKWTKRDTADHFAESKKLAKYGL